MRRRLLLLLVALAALPASAAGQSSEAQPRFRTETALVTVDAVVVDDRGQPVTGLTAADFEVLDEGRDRHGRAES